jgi:hypothetical protein
MNILKTYSLLFSVLGAINLTGAYAANPVEIVNVGVQFFTEKCTKISESYTICKTFPIESDVIAIQLAECSTQGSCHGSWRANTVLDGHIFLSVIDVYKSTQLFQGAEKAFYTIHAQVGNQLEFDYQRNSIYIHLKHGGTLSDTVMFYGPTLINPDTNDRYTTSLNLFRIDYN